MAQGIDMTQHIAFFGQGGSGKSSVATNVAVALAEAGHRVVLIGCDPRSDSVTLLHPDVRARPVHAALATGDTISLSDVMGIGYLGIACIEVGEVMSAGFCVAHGINGAMSQVFELGLLTSFQPDFVLYDMPGETGCPGFSTPVLDTLIQRAYLVTSADLMSLYALNAQLEQLQKNAARELGVGIVANGLNASLEEALVKDFADYLGVHVAANVPRSLVVRQCDLYGKSVLEAAPLSSLAYSYRKIARQLSDAGTAWALSAARPKGNRELQIWARSWGDRIAELEHGLLECGAGI